MAEKQTADKATSVTNSLHVLLLDDEPAVRDAFSRLLKSRGHLCSAAATGELLLDIFERGLEAGTSYDLAILDVKIVGGMGGVETMQRIAQIDVSLPVLSMSGYSVETLFDGDEADGFAGHLEKPFSGEQVIAEMVRVCPTPRAKDGV